MYSSHSKLEYISQISQSEVALASKRIIACSVSSTQGSHLARTRPRYPIVPRVAYRILGTKRNI